MTKEQEMLFKEAVEKQLKDSYLNGLIAGTKSMCGVILEKAMKESATSDEKINDIIKFCKTGLGKNKK